MSNFLDQTKFNLIATTVINPEFWLRIRQGKIDLSDVFICTPLGKVQR